MRVPLRVLAALLSAACALGARAQDAADPLRMPVGPQPVATDAFHPLREDSGAPRRGGRVVVHTPALPRSLNYMIENSSAARVILHELHEPLIRRDWETWEWQGVLAQSWTVEEAGTLWTFQLRPGVRWHDGHELDARDVVFSYECYRNPHVRCDRKRYLFEKIERVEQLGPLSVRFVFAEPYFMAPSVFDDSFTILPAHLYDLSDPAHPRHREGHQVGAEEQGLEINENLHNREWVGLGPYRLVSWEGELLDAARFEGYFDPEHGGWLDALRWRGVRDMGAAFEGLLSGEIDWFERLSSDQFFGSATTSEAFESRAYKGWFYAPYVGYTVWNTQRPQLADARVRRALGMAFDWDDFVRTWYRGLAFRATGEQYYPTENYDRTLEPLPFDLDGAARLLAEAGWYDRDGDGLIDQQDETLRIELVFPAGNETSRSFGLRYQESLARLGVELELVPLSFAALSKAAGERDFDALSLGWVLDFESDPEPLWHSRWAQGSSANRCGLSDPLVDELVESVQRELDPSARAALFFRLQRRLHELQPVQFGLYVPRRFALARRVRNVQLFALDPGYSLRRWWVSDDE